jgi:large subunit ribosomal protein L24
MSGNDKGKKERVLRVLPRENRVVVEHVNFVTKHVRKSRENPYGARHQMEAPIAISNVLLICPGCDCGRRVKINKRDDGTKVRVCAECGREIPKPRYK